MDCAEMGHIYVDLPVEVNQMANLENVKYDDHHPWTAVEGAIVMSMIDWGISSKSRPLGADCSDLMDIALTRIKGVMMGILDPESVMDEIG